MATERNPYDLMPEENSNVIPMEVPEQESEATFEVDPTDGGMSFLVLNLSREQNLLKVRVLLYIPF